MAVIAVGLIRMRNLFAVVMLSGIYSLLAAFLYVIMDAVDVAFTEAAVGAGIATVLMLATLALTGTQEKPSRHTNLLSLAIVTATGAGEAASAPGLMAGLIAIAAIWLAS